MDILIEMNQDLWIIQRTSYKISDVLTDIGGMSSCIVSAFSVFLHFWNYKNFQNYMASRLFKIQERITSSKDKRKKSFQAIGEFIKPTRFCNIGHFLMDLVPHKCRRCCCRKTRAQRCIDNALSIMDDEINIVEIVKSRRYFKIALQSLLD